MQAIRAGAERRAIAAEETPMRRYPLLSSLLARLGAALALGACAAPAAPARSPAPPAPAAVPAQAVAPGAAREAAPAASPAPEATYQGPPRKVRLGYGFVSAEVTPMWLALDQGLFLKHGLDVDTTLIQSSAQVAPAMAAGELDAALSAGAGVVDINLAGGDQVIVATQTNLLTFQLHARSEFRRVEDLRDKRVGTTRIGSGNHLAVTEVFKRAGMEAGRDATLIQGGTSDGVLTALISGATDAAMMGTPQNFLAEREGIPLLVDTKDYGIPYSATAIVVTRPTLQNRYELVRDLVRAYVEAAGLARRDTALGMRTLAKYMNVDDQELLERGYRLWLSTVDPRMWPSAPAVQAVLDHRAAEVPAARTAKPDDFLDERIMRELEQTGYLQRHLGTGT
jgi:ABC-type nitrate/sulfonate/bicarbonate transport system substrate-binding protein